MVSVLTRLLAALRGVGVAARRGPEPGPNQPQVRRAGGPTERSARSDFRIRRMRQIGAFYADSAHQAVLTVGDCTFIPAERFSTAAELVVRTAGDGAAALIPTAAAVRKTIIKRRLGELSD